MSGQGRTASVLFLPTMQKDFNSTHRPCTEILPLKEITSRLQQSTAVIYLRLRSRDLRRESALRVLPALSYPFPSRQVNMATYPPAQLRYHLWTVSGAVTFYFLGAKILLTLENPSNRQRARKQRIRTPHLLLTPRILVANHRYLESKYRHRPCHKGPEARADQAYYHHFHFIMMTQILYSTPERQVYDYLLQASDLILRSINISMNQRRSH